ncbi:putative monooxygenase [Thelonectria olida]|uniref:Monooxygenase n=1 Tax=Thelonectria olida TaxID=1576542 RepID=A0A9P8WHI4_9HYPO|nr:putative monooxygenase [Thelonectria olida]
MDSFIDAEVIIVGAGIGGLTLAAVCKQLGISCKVLERTEVLQPVGAGISLAPNALKLLDQLGIYDQVLEAGQKLKKIQIWRNNKQWNTLDLASFEGTYNYPIMSVERHHFHRLLYDAAGGESTVVLDCKVVDVIDAADKPVAVVLEDGRKFRGNMVVGADGIRSAIRRSLARQMGLKDESTIQFTGRVHFSGMTAPLENCGEGELGVANWMLYDQAILTTWPCPENRQWYIGVKKAEGHVDKNRSVWGATTPGDIKKVYGRAYHPFAASKQFGEVIDKSERVIASNVFQEVEFPSMVQGRVALLGDAFSDSKWHIPRVEHLSEAYKRQPSRGGCQAIEDAAVLGNLLAGSAAQGLKHPEGILNEYAATREGRVQRLSRFSDNFALLHTARVPYGLGGILRWLLYTLVPTWFWISYLGWLYGYQPSIERAVLKRDDERVTEL